jgi:hypothetical protein
MLTRNAAIETVRSYAEDINRLGINLRKVI